MSAHPGRWALLAQAAYSKTLTPAQRLTHVRIALGPDIDEDAVMATLREANSLHLERRGVEAERLLEGLIETHKEATT